MDEQIQERATLCNFSQLKEIGQKISPIVLWDYLVAQITPYRMNVYLIKQAH